MSDDVTDFDCPRCGSPASARFYGPCDACRDQLRMGMRVDAVAAAVPDYEPKVNVTANAVALKDD